MKMERLKEKYMSRHVSKYLKCCDCTVVVVSAVMACWCWARARACAQQAIRVVWLVYTLMRTLAATRPTKSSFHGTVSDSQAGWIFSDMYLMKELICLPVARFPFWQSMSRPMGETPGAVGETRFLPQPFFPLKMSPSWDNTHAKAILFKSSVLYWNGDVCNSVRGWIAVCTFYRTIFCWTSMSTKITCTSLLNHFQPHSEVVSCNNSRML